MEESEGIFKGHEDAEATLEIVVEFWKYDFIKKGFDGKLKVELLKVRLLKGGYDGI